MTTCLFVLLLTAARAQDQEHKLMDRLLRPDTELKNSAQDKKFVADRRSVNKQASVGAFYVQEKPRPKRFTGTGDFSAWEFNARSFHSGKRQANSSSRNQILNSHTRYAAGTTMDLRSAYDANNAKTSRAFAEQRPFVQEGKSQKALSQQNKPLTIEEVRELLNKNK